MYKMFYKFDRDQAINFGKNDKLVYEAYDKFKNKPGEGKSIVRHLMMMSKLSFALIELRIEMEFC